MRLKAAALALLLLAPAPATAPIQFPRDHGAHADAALEWWYWTGHLEGVGRPRLRVPAHVLPAAGFPPRALRVVRRLGRPVLLRREGPPRSAGDRGGRLREARRVQRGLDGAGGEGRASPPCADRGRRADADAPAGQAPGAPRGGRHLPKRPRAERVLPLRVDHPPHRDGDAPPGRRPQRGLEGHGVVRPRVGPGSPSGRRHGLGLVRAAALRRFRADALPDAPDGRQGVAVLVRNVRAGERSAPPDRLERRDAGEPEDLDLPALEGRLPRRLGAAGRTRSASTSRSLLSWPTRSSSRRSPQE